MAEFNQVGPLKTIDPEAAFTEAAEVVNELPPVEPAIPPGKWIKDNLFSSVGSGILTICSLVIVFVTFRSLLHFAFHNPARNWAAVPTNTRLLMTQSYPEADYNRIWLCVAIIAVLSGLSLGMSEARPVIALRRILSAMMAIGATIIAAALLLKNNILMDAEGEFLRVQEIARDFEGNIMFNDDGTEQMRNTNEVIRTTTSEALAGRWWVFALGAALIAVGALLWMVLGDRRRFIFFPFTTFLWVAVGAFVASLWVVPYGHYGLVDGAFIAEKSSTVARSTSLPWTIMWLFVGAAFLVGRKLLNDNSAARTATNVAWFLSPYVLIFVILRKPVIDWGHVLSTDLPMFLAFAIIGGLVLWFLTTPGLGEPGKVIAFGLLLLALFHWLAGFFGWYPMLQKARLSFLVLALFALAAANFAGDKNVRRGYVWIWVAVMAAMHILITIVNTPSALEIQGDSFIGGFLLTIVVTVFSLTLSFPIGVLLALARTSTLPIFRLLSTLFIEISRGIPLITVLFFFATVIPLFLPDGMSITKIAAAVVALVLFSAAYTAENIRGGLQSVRRGQFEAADAVGLTTVQRIGLIVLPQALRVSIPPLVGQAIATYKETSLLAIIGMFDLLVIANTVIPNQGVFRGQRFEPLLFICLIYWIGAYTMSRYSRSLETRLGVGTR